MITAQLDTTVLIGTIIGIALAIIGGLATLIVAAVLKSEDDSWGEAIGTLIIGGIITALVAGGTLVLVWFPFGYAYNHYVPVSGTVSQVNTRFIGDGNGGSTQYFVVWYGSHPYKCDDSRCGGLRKGSRVTLLCEKEFQFNAPSQGYTCNWGKLGLN